MRKYSVFLLLILLTLVGGLYAQDRELVILHTNDTHSQIEPYTYKADTNVGGYLRREALVREVRQQHPNVKLMISQCHRIVAHLIHQVQLHIPLIEVEIGRAL